MRRLLVVASALALVGMTGCDGSEPPATDAGPPIEVDAGPPGACAAPTSGFGTSRGRFFSPLTLATCDGTPYEFYGESEGFCDARFTVLVMSAGWCGPCRAEASEMEAELNARYGPMGVRVIVAIVEDNNGVAADQSFCDGWVTQYGLSNPVLLDPDQDTQIYFPGGALPANLIVDSEGRIMHTEYGFTAAFGTLRAELDQLLME